MTAETPPGYERPTPMRINVPSHAVELCDRCHSIVPIWAWDGHVAWHVNLAVSNALIGAALALASGEKNLPSDVADMVAWAAAYQAP